MGLIWEARNPGWGISSLISRLIVSVERTFSFAEDSMGLPHTDCCLLSAGEEHHLSCSERCCWHPQGSWIQTGKVLGIKKFQTPLWSRSFTHTHTGNGRVLCWSRGPSLGASVVSITNSPATLVYAASTLKVDTGKSHCSHTQFQTPSRGCHIPILWPSGTLNCLNIAGLSYILVIWDSWKPGMWAHLSFLFLLCLVKWECVWR